MTNILFIDTTKTGETVVALEIDGQRFEKRENSQEKRSQSVLPLIELLLKEHNRTLPDIQKINLATGPGSFTGLKVGATIAGTLSLLLHIPINEEKPGTIPEILYGKDHYGIIK